MKQTIRDFDLESKKVLLRVDFNVPVKDGKVLDDTRIIQSIPTILYAIEKKAKVILLSHFGRIKTEEDKVIYDLNFVVPVLERELGRPIMFSKETRGESLEAMIHAMQCGDVLLIQNTRFEDLNGKLESTNNEELGKYWASLGDIFINDAFGTCHRAHASNVGIATYLPSGIGFLIEKELLAFDHMMHTPNCPFSVILGGSKISDKVELIETLAEKADYILIGGGMAYTFLYASGIEIGSSLLDKEHISFCRDILDKYPNKVILPIDTVVSTSIQGDKEYRTCFINEIKEDEIGVDIGYNTVKVFAQYLKESKTILWNGPVGVFEVSAFSKGTCGLLEVLQSIEGMKIAGGGDTASAIHALGYENAMTHISTGGGSSLELLGGHILPGIEVIHEK